MPREEVVLSEGQLWVGLCLLIDHPLSPQYMGCIEVLRSMRSLDFNTRTQVTR